MVCRIGAGYLLRARLLIYVVLLLAGSVVFARMAGEDATARLGGSVQFIIPQRNVRLAALTDAQVPIFVEMPRSAYTAPTDFHIAARDSLSGEEQLLKLRFRGP
jgi:hypothetical protein